MSNILAGKLDTCDDSSRYCNGVPSPIWQNEFGYRLYNFFYKTNKHATNLILKQGCKKIKQTIGHRDHET